MNTSGQYIFTFKLLRELPIYHPIRLDLTDIDFDSTDLTLEARGSYQNVVGVGLALNKFLGGANFSCDMVPFRKDGNEQHKVPKAIGLTKLSDELQYMIAAHSESYDLIVESLAKARNENPIVIVEELAARLREKYKDGIPEEVKNKILARIQRASEIETEGNFQH